MFVTLIITFLLYNEKWLCNFCAIPRPLHWMESTSPLRLSIKEARITGLCATTGAKPARATVCGSCAESLVSSPLLGTLLPPFLQLAAIHCEFGRRGQPPPGISVTWRSCQVLDGEPFYDTGTVGGSSELAGASGAPPCPYAFQEGEGPIQGNQGSVDGADLPAARPHRDT